VLPDAAGLVGNTVENNRTHYQHPGQPLPDPMRRRQRL